MTWAGSPTHPKPFLPPGLPAAIKVIGVGGAGCNALNHMLEMGLVGVEFIAVDADPHSLLDSKVSKQIFISEKAPRGLDGYGDPLKGEKAAEDSLELLSREVQAADMIFIVSGLGSGTGTGAAPVVARLARQAGALTIGVVTRPFTFEGTRRMQTAVDGLDNLKDQVATLIVISDDRLLKTNDRQATLKDAFRKIDDILFQAVRGISDLVTIPGLIRLDFSEVCAILRKGRLAQIAIGKACGEERALVATGQALSSSLGDFDLPKARGILVNVTSGPNLALIEVSQVIHCILAAAHPDVNILFGAVIDPDLGDEIRVTAIAKPILEH
jgi:cell division protein FtsZ